jgi:hypothetical protein
MTKNLRESLLLFGPGFLRLSFASRNTENMIYGTKIFFVSRVGVKLGLSSEGKNID